MASQKTTTKVRTPNLLSNLNSASLTTAFTSMFFFSLWRLSCHCLDGSVARLDNGFSPLLLKSVPFILFGGNLQTHSVAVHLLFLGGGGVTQGQNHLDEYGKQTSWRLRTQSRSLCKTTLDLKLHLE
ncbi:hypothetical protein CEXT_625981 [Caerostris extrusa]|uniref:Uncharacterized protein n=1 Tax=Caerostris extrusa TaxID=172846 RepID=A0AAV4Y1P1_CAEEX|nr:hypothetical protein CEXT_625981 [Caerostris extrusa]